MEYFVATLKDVLAAGDIAAVQVRLKSASDGEISAAVERLGPVIRQAGAALVLNDRPELAAELDCDGVHIGRSDGSVLQARRVIGPRRILGVSCHASHTTAVEAAAQGADYVAFGAFFPSFTKPSAERATPGLLRNWRTKMKIPCVAIGGITEANCGKLALSGADILAVCSGIWDYPAGPVAAASAFKQALAMAVGRR